MLTTNDSVSRAKSDDGKLRVLTTNKVKPKEQPIFPFSDDRFKSVNKREQRKPDMDFIQTADLEDIKRKLTLKAKLEEIRAAKAATPGAEPKRATRKAGRPKKKA